VAYGEQEQAEMILREDPTLLLEKGEITDYSDRTFKGITAFQYALWALDRHMWTMILKYLPPEEAAKQLRDHVDNKKAYKDMHGDYYDFAPLIDAMQTYVNNCENRTDNHNLKHWSDVVGGAQLLVPAHVANEYCRADRSFDPTPTFKEDMLPRSLSFDNYIIPADSHWYISRLGLNFAVLRSASECASAAGRMAMWDRLARTDLAALPALCKVRTDELIELKQQLLNPAQAPEELNPAPEKTSCVIC
jgi:hypothetical protein